MNISYEILWIDDQKDSVQDAVDEISDYIDKQGFEPIIQIASPLDGLDEKLADSKWHLIAMDFTLGGGKTGTELIQKIRSAKHYTEIVFYSSDPDKLEEDLKSEVLEGVYRASREGTDLEDKIKSIINLTLRRVMDVNTMRGIVMAEVAEMDHEMEDIIRIHHKNLKTIPQSKFIRSILKRVGDSLASNNKKVEQYQKACSIDQCLDHRFIDTSKRRRTVGQVFSETPEAANDMQLKMLTACEDTIKQRNSLAHGRTKWEAGEEIIFSPLGEFHLKDAIALRKTLRAHRKNFTALRMALISHYDNEK